MSWCPSLTRGRFGCYPLSSMATHRRFVDPPRCCGGKTKSKRHIREAWGFEIGLWLVVLNKWLLLLVLVLFIDIHREMDPSRVISLCLADRIQLWTWLMDKETLNWVSIPKLVLIKSGIHLKSFIVSDEGYQADVRHLQWLPWRLPSVLLTTLAERHNRTAQEALKERLKIPAFATPEIATVLFLQVRMKWVQVGGWSSRTCFCTIWEWSYEFVRWGCSKVSVAADDLDHLRLHTSMCIYIYTWLYTHFYVDESIVGLGTISDLQIYLAIDMITGWVSDEMLQET